MNEIKKINQGIEGWGKPDNSDEQHYFKGTYSICVKWALFSSTLKKEPLDAFPICKECTKKLERSI